MRLKNIPGSRETIAESDRVVHNEAEWRGRWHEYFGNDHPLRIEIGCGKGRFINTLAAREPGINFLGIEKYSSVLLRAVERPGEANLSFIRMDAEYITDVFTPGEVDRIYLNFSDPWPKDRHAKRRLPGAVFLSRFAQILRPGGLIEFKTDNTDLFDFALESVEGSAFELLEYTRDLHNDDKMNAGNIMTEYEERFSSQGNPIYKYVIRLKEQKLNTDALILDVDGTLWDSTPLVAGAWTRALADEGIEREVRPEELRSLFGKPMNVIADELLPELNEELRYSVMRSCMKYEEKILESNTTDISYPAVTETIKELSNRLPVCIVSNCQSGYIELVMRKLSIEKYITDKECYGNTGLYKAENIRLVVERNGFKNAVYLGDIQGDEDASHAAGIRFIHAAYGFGSAASPDAVIHSFPELLTIF